MTDRDAVRARTSVDCASTGLLTTYGRAPSRTRATTVSVHARDDGSVEVHLPPTAPGARHLLARPVASLQVAPVFCEPVLLHGAARRLPGRSDEGELVFHLTVAVVRVGSPPALLDEGSYSGAAPDPLRHDAPAVLSHLNDRHAGPLAACLRAGGSAADFARATRLDADGLSAVVVGPDGVDTVRLRFPTPITDLRELPPSLAWVLDPGCRCCPSRRSTGAAGG